MGGAADRNKATSAMLRQADLGQSNQALDLFGPVGLEPAEGTDSQGSERGGLVEQHVVQTRGSDLLVSIQEGRPGGLGAIERMAPAGRQVPNEVSQVEQRTAETRSIKVEQDRTTIGYE